MSCRQRMGRVPLGRTAGVSADPPKKRTVHSEHTKSVPTFQPFSGVLPQYAVGPRPMRTRHLAYGIALHAVGGIFFLEIAWKYTAPVQRPADLVRERLGGGWNRRLLHRGTSVVVRNATGVSDGAFQTTVTSAQLDQICAVSSQSHRHCST